MEKGYYRKVTSRGIGPGGWKCACCAPAPGKPKKQWKRTAKKALRRLFTDLVEQT